MADEFGSLLRKWRTSAQLTQRQLVKGLREVGYEHYGESDISKWEHGRTPSEDIVEELEGILSTPKGLLLRTAGYASAAEYRRLLDAESTPLQATVKESVAHEERQDFLTLLQQWREQLRFLSVAELLRKYTFENWSTDFKREVTEPEDVRQAYLHEVRRHLETIPKPYKAMLTVQTEPLFEQLKQLHPDVEVWQAQESWGESCGIYWNAFSSWFAEVECTTELMMGLSVDKGAAEELGGKLGEARQLVKDIKRANSHTWLFLRLLALAVACDMFLLGISRQAAGATWVPVVEETMKLRDDLVFTSMKELPKDFWLTGNNRPQAIAKLFWDKDDLMKKKTIALVKALERLQTAQNNVHDKLKALELRFI